MAAVAIVLCCSLATGAPAQGVHGASNHSHERSSEQKAKHQRKPALDNHADLSPFSVFRSHRQSRDRVYSGVFRMSRGWKSASADSNAGNYGPMLSPVFAL